MKLIGRLFSWFGAAVTAFCLATFLSQGVLLVMLWHRGYLTTEKISRLQAVIANVDYHQIRTDLKQADLQSKLDPNQVGANALTKSQKVSLRRLASDIALIESRLRESGRRFGVQEEAFNGKVNTVETDVQRLTRGQLIRAIKNMATEQAKDNLVQIFNDGGIDDVLAIVRQMTPAEQTKVFAEFQTDEDKTTLNEILKLMRKSS